TTRPGSEPPPEPPKQPGTPTVPAAKDSPGIFVMVPGSPEWLALAEPGGKTWRLHDARSNKQLSEYAGHDGPVTCIAFSADRKLAVTGGADKTLRVWDVMTGQSCAGPDHDNPVVAVA